MIEPGSWRSGRTAWSQHAQRADGNWSHGQATVPVRRFAVSAPRQSQCRWKVKRELVPVMGCAQGETQGWQALLASRATDAALRVLPVMKFSKNLLMILGGILLLLVVGLSVYNWIEVYGLLQAAQRFGTEQRNPNYLIVLAVAGGALGGLLLGLGIAMPRQTFKARYQNQLRADRLDAAETAGFKGASTAERKQPPAI